MTTNYPISSILPVVEIKLKDDTKITHSVIWLHGLGADGNDFAPIVPVLAQKLKQSLNLRFIFPHAPIMPVSLNGGYPMRAWYDIHGLTKDAKTDTAGIAQAVSAINLLIEHEIERGLTYDHIILAGFSQGAALALSTGLLHDQILGGIIALSGYLPNNAEVVAKCSERAAKTPQFLKLPIFIAHGSQDQVVDYAYGRLTCTALKHAGFNPEWHSYYAEHTVTPDEIGDLTSWLNQICS